MQNRKNTFIWFFVFTDHPSPQAIVKQLRKQVTAPKITLTHHKKNHCNAHVMDNLLLMSSCQNLTRGHSTYFYAAQFIGNHEEALTYGSGHFSSEYSWPLSKRGKHIYHPAKATITSIYGVIKKGTAIQTKKEQGK